MNQTSQNLRIFLTVTIVHIVADVFKTITTQLLIDYSPKQSGQKRAGMEMGEILCSNATHRLSKHPTFQHQLSAAFSWVWRLPGWCPAGELGCSFLYPNMHSMIAFTYTCTRKRAENK